MAAKGELVRARQEISSWKGAQGRAGGLTNPATTQAQNQGYNLTHPNIHLICDLLEYMNEPVLQTQTLGSAQHRVTTGKPSGTLLRAQPR